MFNLKNNFLKFLKIYMIFVGVLTNVLDSIGRVMRTSLRQRIYFNNNNNNDNNINNEIITDNVSSCTIQKFTQVFLDSSIPWLLLLTILLVVNIK